MQIARYWVISALCVIQLMFANGKIGVTTMQNELKSCPFCGEKNTNIIACYDDACENGYCDGCDKVRYSVVCNAQTGGCGAICGWKATKEEAINAWNTRTPQKEG